MLKSRTRFSTVIALPVVWLTIQWAVPSAAVAQESVEVPAECSDASSEPTSLTALPQPEIRRSSHGVLKTTLHACIGRNKLVDQASGESTVIHTTTSEGTIPGPTLVVKPGD